MKVPIAGTLDDDRLLCVCGSDGHEADSEGKDEFLHSLWIPF